MENTWRVKLHRKLLDNPIASNGNLLGFLCYLILVASHKDHSFYLWLKKIDQKAGETVISQKKLAKYFKVSISTIHSRIDVLKTESIIETKTNNKYTVISLLNREKYQGKRNQDDTQTESKPKAKRNLAETIKNDKEWKEWKEVSKDTSIAEYGKNNINSLLEVIKKSCSTHWLIYSWKGQKERNACGRLLSKKFSERIAEFNMTLEEFVNNVIMVSTKLKYNTKQVTSAQLLYYNREEIVNKAKQQSAEMKPKESYVDLTSYLNK